MSEKENIQKTDFLSNLRNQKPNTTTKTQEEILDDDIWNQASDEDDDQQVTKISNKMSSNLLAKEDNTKKKYTSLKDLMSDKKNTNTGNNRKKKFNFYLLQILLLIHLCFLKEFKNQNHYQNKKPAANKQEMGFNKPVFVNSNKFYNKNENFSKAEENSDFGFNNSNYNNYDNKYNNKHENKPRQNYNYNTNNSSLNERPKFFSNKPADENKQQSLNQGNIVDKYNMSTNNVYSNPNRNNNVNEKEDTLKKIGTFNNLVKDLQEENSKIKAPKRDYTEIDLTKDKYVSERNKEKERNYLQKPQFVSKNSNEEPRFVELEKDKDLYLKHVQKVEYTNENPGFAGNTKRDKFQYKNKEKESNIGLDEPRRFINSKKIASSENPNAQEAKIEEEVHREEESVNNENHNYGTEYRKFKKHRDDLKYYDSLINGEAHIQEEKQDFDKLSHDYKDSNKSHHANYKTQNYGVRKASDGKDNKPRKSSNIPEPIILKKTDKTLKELLDGK